MYDNPPIVTINYKYVCVTSPHRRRVGPRGAATWPGVPRRIHVGPAQKINTFFLFFNLF